LSCLIRAPCWAGAPRWGGRQRCWPAPPPPTTLGLLGPAACGAGRHPSSPVLLSESSVGQRGISAQTIQLLVPVTLETIRPYRCSSTSFSTSAGPLPTPATPARTCNSLISGLALRTSLRSTAASATTGAVSSLNSPDRSPRAGHRSGRLPQGALPVSGMPWGSNPPYP
jgi:hypothetical protein